MKLKEIKPKDYVIYVDMDGVLADLQSFIKKLTGRALRDDDKYDKESWKQFHDHMKDGNKTFEEFKKLPDTDKLWSYIRKYKPHILTATGTNLADEAAKQKRAWVKKHLTGFDQIHTPQKSAQKAKWAWPDAILIDDRMKSIGPWREKGGIGIHHKSAADTIKQLKKLGL